MSTSYLHASFNEYEGEVHDLVLTLVTMFTKQPSLICPREKYPINDKCCISSRGSSQSYHLYSMTVNVLIQGHALIDAHAPAAQNTSHPIHTKCPIKHQKIIQKPLKFKQHSGLFGCRTCANHHFLVSKGLRDSCLPYTLYMHIARTERQPLFLKLIDAHPSPCTRALFSFY